MKRLMLSFFCSLIMFAILMPLDAYSYELDGELRVGLETGYKAVYSVVAANEAINIGTEEGGVFRPEAKLRTSGGFEVKTTDEHYAALEPGQSYAEAVKKAESLIDEGYTAVPAFLNASDWAVYIGPYQTRAEAEAVSGSFSNCSASTGLAKLKLAAGGRDIMVFDGVYPQLEPADGDVLILKDTGYRGRVEFGRYSGGAMTAVNVIDMEKYLYGVVPAEMPALYNQEALKAQAVAARTYAAEKAGAHSASGYDICDTTHCQVYRGQAAEMESANKAVDSTRGEMIYYGDTLINAVFFASSGGATDNSENVWANEIPYLRGKPEINELDATQWEKSFTAEQLEEMLNSSGRGIGRVTDIMITQTSAYGRIYAIRIVGEEGALDVEREDIKTFFSPIGVVLPTRMFTINGKGEPVNSAAEYNVPQGGGYSGLSAAEIVAYHTAAKPIRVSDSFQIGGDNVIVLGDDFEFEEFSLKEAEDKQEDMPSETGAENRPAPVAGQAGAANKTVSISTAAEDGVYQFKGAGNGHAVGMSQKGANGMAAMGYSYKDILTYYYTDVTIR